MELKPYYMTWCRSDHSKPKAHILYRLALLILSPQEIAGGFSSFLFIEVTWKQIRHFPRLAQIKWTITIGIPHVNI